MGGPLKVGAANADITPPLGVSMIGHFNDRKAREVHDPLTARAMVVDNGARKLALVVCDVCILERAETDAAKAMIEKECGLPKQDVMICATHTHTGPATTTFPAILNKADEYCAWLSRRIADAVLMASQRMEEAYIGFGVGCEPTQVFNRRYVMKDGSVRMNPGYKNPDIVRPAGPIDPDVWVLAFRRPDDRLAAVLANYALHYVGGGPTSFADGQAGQPALRLAGLPGLSAKELGSKDQFALSADYFTDFCRILERMIGYPAWTALSNGCCGDVNNVDVNADYVEKRAYRQRERVATILAAEVMKALEKMRFETEVKLGAELTTLTIQRRQPSERQLKSAEELFRKDPDGKTVQHVYAAHWLHMRDHCVKEDETYISALRFNDLAVVGLPGEVFVEHGLALKRRSPFKNTMVAELANDWIGYIPTQKAFKEGSYETDLALSSRSQPEAGDLMVETALKLLEKLKTQ